MVHVLILVVLVAAVGATREIEFKKCKSTSGKHSENLTCKVKSVEINGCLSPTPWVEEDGNIVEYRKGSEKNPCRIEWDSVLRFKIAFQPGFAANFLRSQFVIPDLTNCSTPITELHSTLCSLSGPPRSGCLHTKCPLEPGREQWFDVNQRIPIHFLSRPFNSRKIYELRWTLWNKKNKEQKCCFTIPVQY
ncbi:MD-2-related lipid-recognition protein-like [Homalodisca vitripennis]|uniref:MD-2-related lipid-recognition protein-like n=1 Tax=Homalodisca vitripennis TaxID=197043 RepID=UPI001EEA5B02|nr:MD-2-related lipid-recognition protein-like [Homalodisca vitripennis]